MTVLMTAVTLNLRLCSCFLFKVFFRFGKSRLFTLNAVYGQLCFLCVAKNRVLDGKNRGDNAEKEGAGFGRQSQIKKKQPQRVKSNLQTGGKKFIRLAF